jgi:hypothetical protein
MIMSGLRIEIEWETPDIALVAFDSVGNRNSAEAHAGRITSYVIDNPYFAIRSVQLTDSAQRSLNEMSAQNGLELVYCDYERTDRVENAASVNMEIRKSASRALKAFLITRSGANTNNPVRDSFSSELWKYKYWQWQLGALYFPQQPVSSNIPEASGPEFAILAESYKHALVAHDTYRGGNAKCSALPLYNSNGYLHNGLVNNEQAATDISTLSPHRTDTAFVPLIDLGEPVAEFDYGTFANGNGCVAVTLERSDLFNLSGVPINNSRVLAVRATYVGAAEARHFSSFLKFVRLARVFMNNTEVEQ